MSAISLAYQVDSLNRIIDNLSSEDIVKPLLDRLGRVMLTDTQMNFRQQQEPSGKKWKPTARGGQILSDTGRLKRSIRMQVDGDAVYIGTNLIYAATHQFGATIKPKHAKYLVFAIPGGGAVAAKQVEIPARPFIGIEGRQAKKINREIDKWLDSISD